MFSLPGKPIRRLFRSLINSNPPSSAVGGAKPQLASSTVRNLIYSIIPQIAVWAGLDLDPGTVEQAGDTITRIAADLLSLWAIVRAYFGRRKANAPLA